MYTTFLPSGWCTMRAAGDRASVTPQADDHTLIARARGGDTAAFEHLVRRYSGPVYRIALRVLGETWAADDVAQEAFITAWRRIGEIRAEQAFAAWIYRIVTTRAINTARSHRHEAGLNEAFLPPSRAVSPEQHALAVGLRAALTRALGTLTPQQRACWVLKELEGLSYDEIAGITRASRAAVRGRIYRARVRLAEELTSWR
jgi:RNA polymerase sigma-70 factor, ECF subfamily